MGTQLPQTEVIDALAAEYAAIDELVSGLSEQQWNAQTPCPGWDVRAALAHIVGTELALSGSETPAELPESWSTAHVRNDVGTSNERWIAYLTSGPTADLVASYRDITARRLAALRQMDHDAWDAEGFTPVGRESYGRFMRVRVFDCWMHEQDMRTAIAQPGHVDGVEVDFVLDEITSAIGYVVGKKGQAPLGSSVTFELTGEPGRRIDISVEGRAQVVDQLPEPATVTLRMPVLTFTQLAGGRIDAAGAGTSVQISGDDVLGQRIVDNLAYTI
jgi:uncharacterized protein (TIGR03083 family)